MTVRDLICILADYCPDTEVVIETPLDTHELANSQYEYRYPNTLSLFTLEG